MESILIRLGTQSTFRISDTSDIAAARRAGNELARRLRFDDVRTGQLALVVTEAGTNIVKHAGTGEILMRAVHILNVGGIEVIAIDSGQGIDNLPLQMLDGQSTTGTYGGGLGAMKRLAQEMEIYTLPGKGTAIAMTIWSNGAIQPARNWSVGAVCSPMPGEEICGDAWHAAEHGKCLVLSVADGLGHGPDAAKASVEAMAVCEENLGYLPSQALQASHERLRGSRGAALAIARIDTDANELRFTGVGNIAACVLIEDEYRHLLSHNGIVGSNLRKIQEFVHPWEPSGTIFMHSDGLSTRWDLDQYPGLKQQHPSIIAAVLYRDFSRKRDDSTIVVVRGERGN